jgi:hypothetical protein
VERLFDPPAREHTHQVQRPGHDRCVTSSIVPLLDAVNHKFFYPHTYLLVQPDTLAPRLVDVTHFNNCK